MLLRFLFLAFVGALGLAAQSPTDAPPVALYIEVRGLENGALIAGDPVRVAVGLLPAGENESVRLDLPAGVPWRAAVRVRLHRADGRAIGEPALLGGSLGANEIEFSAESPAAGIWRWPGRATAELPPGVYRVSARLLAPQTTDGKTPPPLAVAEAQFTLAAAPETMTPAQRVRWHHRLAMDAFLVRDLERARRLNAAVLAAEPAHAEGLRLQAALERSRALVPTATATAATPGAPQATSTTPSSAPPPLASKTATATALPPRQPEKAPQAATTSPAPAAAGSGVRWAANARASSQYEVKRWGAANAVGPANIARYGDSPESWTPRTESAGEEWLELIYEPAVAGASGVRVYQNFNPGALMRIELISPDGAATTVWTGPDTTAYAPNQIGILDVRFPSPEKPVARVKLTLDTKRVRGWKEIDAVALVVRSE